MSRLETETVRRTDGSIDLDHYRALARSARAREARHLRRAALALLRGLASRLGGRGLAGAHGPAQRP